MVPLSPELKRLHLTIDQGFAVDLDRAKALLSHVVPDGNLTDVLRECVRRTIVVLEKRRRGGDRAGAPRGAPKGRTIPAQVRREVWERDGGTCAFVGSTGVRCESTYQIQFHHIVPFARGGEATAANVSLRCSRHNLFHAEKDYGTQLLEHRSGRAAAEAGTR